MRWRERWWEWRISRRGGHSATEIAAKEGQMVAAARTAAAAAKVRVARAAAVARVAARRAAGESMVMEGGVTGARLEGGGE